MASDFKQYNYPNYVYAGESAAASACGPFSCANLLDKDPVEMMNWMTKHGYAINGWGTAWGGINDCLTAYGGNGKLTAVGLLGKANDPAIEAWKESIQSGNMGILDMGVGKNNYWTNGGHYIAIQKYDKSTGKYYVADSASVARTGWHNFSDFQYNIKNTYTSTIKWATAPEIITYTHKLNQIKKGSTGARVLLAQMLLFAEGYYTDKLDGSFGNNTDAAVRKYQKAKKLVVDGIVGPATWSALIGTEIKDDLKVVFNQVTRGDAGWDVLVMQKICKAYGYYLGMLDKRFGNGTFTAVQLLQKRLGIPADGVAGPITWKAALSVKKLV